MFRREKSLKITRSLVSILEKQSKPFTAVTRQIKIMFFNRKYFFPKVNNNHSHSKNTVWCLINTPYAQVRHKNGRKQKEVAGVELT